MTHTVIISTAEDYYLGDAKVSLAVDGIVLSPLTITAINANNERQHFTVILPDAAQHTLTVTFLNDLYGGSPTTDRNAYVAWVSYDGVTLPNSAAALYRTGDSLTVKVGTPAPTITGITFTPSVPTLADNTPAGSKVSQATVTMSDGSTFNGFYSISDPTGLFTITSSGAVVTARPMTSTDDGTHAATVTATASNGVTAAARFPAT
jgi:hypothetical protein